MYSSPTLPLSVNVVVCGFAHKYWTLLYSFLSRVLFISVSKDALTHTSVEDPTYLRVLYPWHLTTESRNSRRRGLCVGSLLIFDVFMSSIHWNRTPHCPIL